jgi:hypothetical protein
MHAHVIVVREVQADCRAMVLKPVGKTIERKKLHGT